MANSKAPAKEEETTCIICANPIVYTAFTPCNHQTCHTCAFRQRALYEKKQCLVCRTENESVTFSDGPNPIQAIHNEKYGVFFSNSKVESAVLSLLEFKCSFGDVCDAKSYKKLNEHLKDNHMRQLCLICAHNKKAFPCELTVYTHKALQQHMQRGDGKGFKGHPQCQFCKNQRFYSDDELYLHLRDKHERCHLCTQQHPELEPQWFANYDTMFEHFKQSHYVCYVPSCLDNKFVVFGDELDLQAHMLKEHGGMHGSQKRFTSELSTFRHPVVQEQQREAEDTPQVKRMRLEERAKHYLNYNVDQLRQFGEVNEGYRQGKLTAAQVVARYTKIFSVNPDADVLLLVYDLAGTFNKNTPKNKDLLAYYNNEQKKQNHENEFPALPGTITYAPAPKVKAKKQKEDFPALSAPTTTFAPVNTTVKYRTITQQSPSVAPVLRKQTSPDPTYRPSYLNSGSSSSSLKKKLNNSDFPELPMMAPKKKVIPRVNPVNIPDPKQWGKSSSSLDLTQVEEALPQVGKKKKKKQLLFHIGV